MVFMYGENINMLLYKCYYLEYHVNPMVNE